jgi:hypothetical protein
VTDEGTAAAGTERLWRVAGLVISQTALLTALLFYFGWARTRATFGYFGIDVSLLGFSTSDYLLRSVNAAFRPLLVVGLAALVAAALHQRWRGVIQRAATPLGIVGVVLVAIGLSGLVWTDWGSELGAWLPVCLAAGFGLLAYRVTLVSRRPGAELVLLSGLAVLGVFWAVSLYAEQVGRDRATAFARSLAAREELVLYSKERLAIQGPGINVTELRFADSAYRFRYAGLRLLLHSDGRYLVLPAGWTHGGAAAFLIPDGAGMRTEVIARASG